MTKRILCALIFLLAACQQQREQQDILISVDPARLATCDPAAEVLVRWDFSGIPGVKGVNVFVGSAPNEKLFAAGGASGSAKTGSWARPGTKFVAKEDSGRVLSEVDIQGPKCP